MLAWFVPFWRRAPGAGCRGVGRRGGGSRARLGTGARSRTPSNAALGACPRPSGEKFVPEPTESPFGGGSGSSGAILGVVARIPAGGAPQPTPAARPGATDPAARRGATDPAARRGATDPAARRGATDPAARRGRLGSGRHNHRDLPRLPPDQVKYGDTEKCPPAAPANDAGPKVCPPAGTTRSEDTTRRRRAALERRRICESDHLVGWLAAPDGGALVGWLAAPDGGALGGWSAAPDGGALGGWSAAPDGGALGGSAAPQSIAGGSRRRTGVALTIEVVVSPYSRNRSSTVGSSSIEPRWSLM